MAVFSKFITLDKVNEKIKFGNWGYELADYVVEEGVDGIWTYRKWASGLAECWGRVGSKMYDMTSTSGYGYYTSNSLELPSGLFGSVTYASSDRCGGKSANGLIATDVREVTTTYISYFIWCTLSLSLDVDVALSIKGRWDVV